MVRPERYTPMTADFYGDPMLGVVDLAENITPVDVWQGLHLNATAWREIPDDHGQDAQRRLIDESDLSVLSVMSNYPAGHWSRLCDATGWTVYGAVALSWCSGAELSDVWDGWLASGFPLMPLPASERPARLINPALRPSSRNISTLIQASTPNTLGLCALIAALDEPLVIDMAAKQFANAPPQVASFLKSRLLASGDKIVDRSLLDMLERTLEGTLYDLWADERPAPAMAAM